MDEKTTAQFNMANLQIARINEDWLRATFNLIANIVWDSNLSNQERLKFLITQKLEFKKLHTLGVREILLKSKVEGELKDITSKLMLGEYEKSIVKKLIENIDDLISGFEQAEEIDGIKVLKIKEDNDVISSGENDINLNSSFKKIDLDISIYGDHIKKINSGIEFLRKSGSKITQTGVSRIIQDVYLSKIYSDNSYDLAWKTFVNIVFKYLELEPEKKVGWTAEKLTKKTPGRKIN